MILRGILLAARRMSTMSTTPVEDAIRLKVGILVTYAHAFV